MKERRYYSMEFDNEMRILNESMQIIKRTKNLDTLLSRKDLCFRTFDRLSFLNDRYKFIPSYSMPVRGDIIRACELCEKKLIASEQESKFRSEICISLNDIICDCVKESSGLHSSEPQEQIPFEISEFANSIFSSYVSLYPWNQGIDMNFKIHPENVDRAIACYRSQIQYFYAQKDEFASLGEPYVKAWEKCFDHCHNARKPDFCLVETAEESLDMLIKNRSFYLDPDASVLDVIKDNPGIMQKSFPEFFHPDLKDYVLSTVRKLASEGKIIRTRVGHGYALCLPEDMESSIDNC